MFTGIIHTVGTVRERRRSPAGVTFTVAGVGSEGGVVPGDSVAVNGVCQTVERVEPRWIVFTAVGETLRRTTLGSLRVGARVNIEKAATAQSALGGHIVQGHVDGIGTVRSFVRVGRDWLLKLRVPRNVADLVVDKGSIAVDGMSLTVIECGRGGMVSVTIVPYTREHTVVHGYRSGMKVNIEADALAKYVRRYAGKARADGAP
jgi:riboflavin synthase alpha subunit